MLRQRPFLLLLVPLALGLGCSLVVDTGGEGACLQGQCAKGFVCVNDRCVSKAGVGDAGTPPVEQCVPACSSSQACFLGKCVAAQTITGTRQLVYWPDQGSLPPKVPGDVQQTQVGALVGAPGGGRLFAGSFKGDGSFTIPNVPVGKYLLRFVLPDSPPLFVETTSTSLDLGEDVPGRPDVDTAAGETPVTMSLSGLAPLDRETASLQVYSSNAALWFTDEPALPPGATSLDWTYDWSQTALGLLPDGRNHQDVTFVHQMAETDYGSYRVRSATRYAKLPGDFTVTAGRSQSLGVWMEGAPQTGMLTVDWRVGEFTSLLSQVNPRAQEPENVVFVDVNAHRSSLWPPSGAPDLLAVLAAPGSGSLMLGPLYYGQFLPPLWREFMGVLMSTSVSFTAPGAATDAPLWASITTYDSKPNGAAILSPRIGPPRSPQVGNGSSFGSAFEPRSGVGTTPVLAWQAPDLSQPTSYEVALYELVADTKTRATRYRTVLVAALSPTTLSFAVPAGPVTSGKTYVGQVNAVYQPGDTYATAPLRWSLPYSRAETVIGPFSP